jgi:hypothetical protein
MSLAASSVPPGVSMTKMIAFASIASASVTPRRITYNSAGSIMPRMGIM